MPFLFVTNVNCSNDSALILQNSFATCFETALIPGPLHTVDLTLNAKSSLALQAFVLPGNRSFITIRFESYLCELK